MLNIFIIGFIGIILLVGLAAYRKRSVKPFEHLLIGSALSLLLITGLYVIYKVGGYLIRLAESTSSKDFNYWSFLVFFSLTLIFFIIKYYRARRKHKSSSEELTSRKIGSKTKDYTRSNNRNDDTNAVKEKITARRKIIIVRNPDSIRRQTKVGDNNFVGHEGRSESPEPKSGFGGIVILIITLGILILILIISQVSQFDFSQSPFSIGNLFVLLFGFCFMLCLTSWVLIKILDNSFIASAAKAKTTSTTLGISAYPSVGDSQKQSFSIKDLIESGDLPKALGALRVQVYLLKNEDLINTFTLLNMRYKDLEKRFLENRITQKEYTVEKSQLGLSILTLEREVREEKEEE